MKCTTYSHHSEFVKFSWLDEPIDITQTCKFCIIAKNSECDEAAEKFFDAVQRGVPEAEEEKLWETTLQCLNKHREMFLERDKELNEKLKNLK